MSATVGISTATVFWLVFGTANDMGAMQQKTAVMYSSEAKCLAAKATVHEENLRRGAVFSIPPYCTTKKPWWWVSPSKIKSKPGG